MKTDVFNKIKFVIIAAVIILSVALFKLNINSNTLFYKTQELINKMGWFNNRTTTVGSVSLSSASYYGTNLLTPLESETNYANKVKQVRFGMTTTDITNPEDLMYAVVFDNSKAFL